MQPREKRVERYTPKGTQGESQVRLVKKKNQEQNLRSASSFHLQATDLGQISFPTPDTGGVSLPLGDCDEG